VADFVLGAVVVRITSRYAFPMRRRITKAYIVFSVAVSTLVALVGWSDTIFGAKKTVHTVAIGMNTGSARRASFGHRELFVEIETPLLAFPFEANGSEGTPVMIEAPVPAETIVADPAFSTPLVVVATGSAGKDTGRRIAEIFERTVQCVSTAGSTNQVLVVTDVTS